MKVKEKITTTFKGLSKQLRNDHGHWSYQSVGQADKNEKL